MEGCLAETACFIVFSCILTPLWSGRPTGPTREFMDSTAPRSMVVTPGRARTLGGWLVLQLQTPLTRIERMGLFPFPVRYFLKLGESSKGPLMDTRPNPVDEGSCDCESERRRWKDHDRDQSIVGLGASKAADSHDRSRSPGQCDKRDWARI